MKKLLVIALSAMMLAACGSKDEAIYKAGTYSATEKGFGGEVVVEVTVSETEITNVTVTAAGETAGIGSVAAEDLAKAMTEGKTVEVDAVSGATVTSEAVLKAAGAALAQAK